jgi:uncharacterized protein (DUF885 family)
MQRSPQYHEHMPDISTGWRPLGAALIATLSLLAAPALGAARAFDTQVDAFLEQFARYHPSIAAGNGLHAQDARLEDYSQGAISHELRWLRRAGRELDELDDVQLTPDQSVDRRILRGIVDGWVLDLEIVRTWQHNPMVYVVPLSDGLHNLITMESADAATRMTQVTSKLRGLPALLQAARENVRQPPRVFVERALDMLGGVSDLLEHDLPAAFPARGTGPERGAMLAAAATANRQLSAYRLELETRVLPHATAAFALGLANVEARYRAEELIDLPAAQLLAIGERELAVQRAAFERVAASIDGTRPAAAVWQLVQSHHPAAGELVPAAQAMVDELFAFIDARGLMWVPPHDPVIVALAPAYDIGLASMHASPPLDPHPVKSFYYVTDVQPGWSEVRREAWLRTFNYATLADISAHEVAPGHYVHSLFMRRTPGKIRRIWLGLNPFPQPSSGQDGWAHYAEQLVSDEGFHADDPRYRLAQIAEAQIRICRLIAGLKLHGGDWTLEQAGALFEQEAHLLPERAMREAVRGTYDPTYGGYFLGKLAALKLRHDYQARQGTAFDLREFHERVMSNGIAPWWAHRQLLLPGDRGAVLD